MSSTHPLAVPSFPSIPLLEHRDSLLILVFTVSLLLISSRFLKSARSTNCNETSNSQSLSQTRSPLSDANLHTSSAVASESDEPNSPHADRSASTGQEADEPQIRRSTGILSSFFDMLATTFYARPFPFAIPVPMPIPMPIPFPIPGCAPAIDHAAPDAEPKLRISEAPWPVKQPYDAFLVLDVEATCMEGTNFDWPNEIIVRN